MDWLDLSKVKERTKWSLTPCQSRTQWSYQLTRNLCCSKPVPWGSLFSSRVSAERGAGEEKARPRWAAEPHPRAERTWRDHGKSGQHDAEIRRLLWRPPSGDSPSGDPHSGDPPSGDPPLRTCPLETPLWGPALWRPPLWRPASGALQASLWASGQAAQDPTGWVPSSDFVLQGKQAEEIKPVALQGGLRGVGARGGGWLVATHATMNRPGGGAVLLVTTNRLYQFPWWISW